MKLKDLMIAYKNNNKSLIPSDYISLWSEKYRENATTYDEYFTYYEKNRILNLENDNISESMLLVFSESRILGCLLDNEYKYTRLYNTTIQEYNPIHNYDSTSETTTIYGEMNNTSQNGEINSTNTSIDSTTTFLSNTENEKQKNINTSMVSPTTSTTNIGTHTDTISTKTSGNIGVTTTAQLLMGERQLALFSFFKVVFEDIINALCLDFYEGV